jgi:hypothetical protein
MRKRAGGEFFLLFLGKISVTCWDAKRLGVIYFSYKAAVLSIQSINQFPVFTPEINQFNQLINSPPHTPTG